MYSFNRHVIVGIATALAVFTGEAGAAPGDISLISVRSPGQVTSMYGSFGARISADAHYLAFFSTSPDLVAGLTDARKNLYFRNLQTGAIAPLRLTATDGQRIALVDSFSISADARYVAFDSRAGNLVPNDTNTNEDVFVTDRQTGLTERVSVSTTGAQARGASYAPSISADGRYVAFYSGAANLVPGDSNGVQDVFVHDRQTGHTERVSVSTAGVQGNGRSYSPSISSDGRYVAFTSDASNLVAGDLNGATSDIFVHDRVTGTTERVSRGLGASEADDRSDYAQISGNGRFVVFASYADNLVVGDTNGASDLFVYDRQAGTTDRVNVTSSGAQTYDPSIVGLGIASISTDGRFVSFASYASNLVVNDANNVPDVFVHDRLTGQTMLASVSTGGVQGNAASVGGSLSADGRYLAFDSNASNLVAGDRNGSGDVYLRDRQTSTLTVASTNVVRSTAAGGLDTVTANFITVGGPSISANGRYVAFLSTAPNLVAGQPILPDSVSIQSHAFVRDRQAATTVQIAPERDVTSILMSADASTIVISDGNTDPPSRRIVDRLTGASESIPAEPYETGVGLSSDGRFVAFASDSADLVPGDTNAMTDVFVLDRRNHQYQRVSVSSQGLQADSGAQFPAISADGRYVAFSSSASNLVPGGLAGVTAVFVKDRQTGQIQRASTDSNGVVANASSDFPFISADGRYVGFSSDATNLVPGDTNDTSDVFVKDRLTGHTARVSVDSNGVEGNNYSYSFGSWISPDGRFTVFYSAATNLVPNYAFDFFIHDRQTGITQNLLTDPTTQSPISIPQNTFPSFSADQRFVAFDSDESLVKADLNQSARLRVDRPSISLAKDTYVQERSASTSALTVAPKSVAFGSQRINTTSAARSVTVTNTTSAAVPITGIRLGGSNPGQFVQTNNCGSSLAGHATCTIQVKFKPTTQGAKSATLSVNGGGGGLRTVTLTGTGT